MRKSHATNGQVVRLDAVCKIVQGGRHKLSGKHFIDAGGYPAYGAGGHNGNLPSFEFDEPAIVLSAIGARCGKCFQPSGKWSSLANTSVFLPDPKQADVRFLWYQLNDESSWHRSGTAQPYIKPSDIKGRKIYLPPLAVQKRIAGILDAADALRVKRREALGQLDTLLQSTFLDMFGDPVTNPMGWETVAFTETGRFISGSTPSKARDDFWDGSIPWVSPKDMKRSFIAESIDTITEAALSETAIKLVKIGCILIVVRGMILAHTFPVALTTGNVTINQDMKAIEPDSRFLPPYLLMALQAQQREILAAVSSSAHGTKKFDKKAMESVQVPVPPLDLQRRFAAFVDLVEQQKARMRSHFTELDSLFASLQSRAFNGEL